MKNSQRWARRSKIEGESLTSNLTSSIASGKMRGSALTDDITALKISLFPPKPFQKPHIPIWVGGEGARAQRRAAAYGDAWFPYFVRITPQELARRFENVRRWAAEGGRNPDQVNLNCCLPIEVSTQPAAQDEG